MVLIRNLKKHTASIIPRLVHCKTFYDKLMASENTRYRSCFEISAVPLAYFLHSYHK